MENQDENFTRPATWDDVVCVCRLLNEAGVEYMLIGGMPFLPMGSIVSRTTSIFSSTRHWKIKRNGFLHYRNFPTRLRRERFLPGLYDGHPDQR